MSTDTVTTTIIHRYPWTTEERAIIAVLVLAPVALVAWRQPGPGSAVWVWLVAAAGWVAAAALYRLGASRKRRSQVTAVLRGTHLQVTGGRVQSSRGDVAGTRSVQVQHLGPETVLVLTGPGASALRVSTRVADDPAVAAVLTEHLLQCDVVLSDEARGILQAL